MRRDPAAGRPGSDAGTSSATVAERFTLTETQYPDHPFLLVPASACRTYSDRELSFSYREAGERIRALRECYAASGLTAGARVALLLENRPAFFFHWFALNGLGVSVVPLNPDHREAELSFALAHSEARLAVAIGSRLDDLRRAAAARGLAIPVIDEASLPDSSPRVAEAATVPAATALERECALLYTSGTTGVPKGCVLSNDYFLRSGLRYLNRRGYVQLEPGASRVLTPLPMFHMNAMAGSTMGVLFAGGCVIQLDRFHPSTWWQDVSSSGATGVHCLGVMPAILLRLPPCEAETRHAVRYGTAANVEPQHHRAFERRFGFPLIEGWSMTETGAGAAISADDEPRHIGMRCFGRVPPNLELRLVDEADHDVPPGEPGEIIVRAKGGQPRLGFFSGYLKDEAATEHGWRAGWWHTGDIARFHPDGSLLFVDRRKNLIRRSGENVSALEVEVVLREHPAIAAVAVTAVADEVRGEEVFAFVQKAADQGAPGDDTALAAAIVEWTAARLAYFKLPGWLAFVPSLPTTATQKVERGELRRMATEAVVQGGCLDLRADKTRARQAAR
mgnify:CR=1 FL=1